LPAWNTRPEKIHAGGGRAGVSGRREGGGGGQFRGGAAEVEGGRHLSPFHGLAFDEKNRHAETYTVVGVLAPTNTPADRVIWIPLAGVQTMSGHDPRAATDVSAVLVQLRAPSRDSCWT